MSNSKIQNTLHVEALAATMQERRTKKAAWLEREARRRNGGTTSHNVKLEIRAEMKNGVRSAEENGEWVTMTSNGKVAGIREHGKRSHKKREEAKKSSVKNACHASKFSLLDLESDDETDQEISADVIAPISNEFFKENIKNTWATVAMSQLPSNHVAQKWDKVEKLAEQPSSTKVSDYIAQATTNDKKPIMDAWEDSDDETVIPTTNNKKSWFDMMEDSDEED